MTHLAVHARLLEYRMLQRILYVLARPQLAGVADRAILLVVVAGSILGKSEMLARSLPGGSMISQ